MAVATSGSPSGLEWVGRRASRNRRVIGRLFLWARSTAQIAAEPRRVAGRRDQELPDRLPASYEPGFFSALRLQRWLAQDAMSASFQPSLSSRARAAHCPRSAQLGSA